MCILNLCTAQSYEINCLQYIRFTTGTPTTKHFTVPRHTQKAFLGTQYLSIKLFYLHTLQTIQNGNKYVFTKLVKNGVYYSAQLIHYTYALLFMYFCIRTNTHLGMSFNSIYPVFGDEVVGFIIASTRYCLFLDQLDATACTGYFLPEVQSLLCQVYTTVLKLPPCEEDQTILLERFITETNYEFTRKKIKSILGDADVYLDVAIENNRYLDTPVSVSISESLADLYQTLGDCVGIFKTENEISIQASIAEALNSFKYEWGSKLLSVMRRLHELHFSEANDDNSENHNLLYEY